MAVLSAEQIEMLAEGLDRLRVGIAVFDANDIAIYANEQYRYLYPSFRSINDVVGKSFETLVRHKLTHGDICDPDALNDPEGWLARRLRFHRDPASGDFDEHLADGRWIQIRERRMLCGGRVGIWSDVTAERAARAWLDAAMDAMGDGFAIWGPNNQLVTCSEVYLDLFRNHGVRAPEVGEHFNDVMARAIEARLFEFGDLLHPTPEEVLDRRQEKSDYTMRHASGRWIQVSVRPAAARHTAISMVDVTPRVEREQELQKLLQDLELAHETLGRQSGQMALLAEELNEQRMKAVEASGQKDMFLRSFSHEIRTPLNAIIGFSEMMVHEYLGPLGNDQYREYAADIFHSGSHLLALINNLLDLSKIQAGKYPFSPEYNAVHETLREALRMVEPLAGTRGIALADEIGADLPCLHFDQVAVRQVTVNLLANAIKFTDAGGKVTLRALQTDGHIRISVIDTGIGIAPEDIKRVMQPFEQTRAGGMDPARGKGSGLGLPIARALVELHGGEFLIDSRPGEGTAMTFSLPFDNAAAQAVPQAVSPGDDNIIAEHQPSAAAVAAAAE